MPGRESGQLVLHPSVSLRQKLQFGIVCSVPSTLQQVFYTLAQSRERPLQGRPCAVPSKNQAVQGNIDS